MKEKISIIVPVYNGEGTLDRCVRSLLSQSYENLEILLVNDGSQDDSLAVCRRFSREDPRVRVIDQPNGGVSSARNAGLEQATGEFVMFCDCDDWAMPDWCRSMREAYRPGDLVMCHYLRWDGQTLRGDGEPAGQAVVAERKEIFHYPMLMCSLWNKIFSREIIEKYALRFSRELRMGEDFCFVLEYVCRISGQVRILPQGLYCYDVSQENSLSKCAVPLAQSELLFQNITDAMARLEATDSESKLARDRLVMPHLERWLMEISQRGDLSIAEKLKETDKIKELSAFQAGNADVMPWLNPVYLWLWREKKVKLAMLFRVIRNVGRKEKT